MPDYKNGKIYKIESLEGNCMYIGSTCQKLSMRMAAHRCDYKKGLNIDSAKVTQYPDAKIYLLELYPCNTKEELLAREGHHIKNNDCVNKRVAGRTRQEHYIDNKEDYQKKNKINYEQNKQNILKKCDEYREKNKEAISITKKKCYEQKKDYYSAKGKEYAELNKEKIAQYKKEYAELNKEKIKEKRKKKYECICGSTINLIDKARHLRTKKHLNFITPNA